MKRLTLLMFVVLIGVTFLFVGTITTVEAKQDKEDPQNPESLLQPWTNNGVSQYLASTIFDGTERPLRLYNPNNKTHAAAVLAYNLVRSPEDAGNAEQFLGCYVASLSPHAAVGIRVNDFLVNPPERTYIEVISVPEDGYHPYFYNLYGINGQHSQLDNGGGPLALLDPVLFTGPRAAIECECDDLVTLDDKTFNAFGITITCGSPR